MTLIKIDRESIKPNPRAGATSSMFQGPKTASFEFPDGGKIPAALLDKVLITEWRGMGLPEDSIHLRGHITNPDDWQLLAKIPGISIKIDQGLQRIDHRPEPAYLYKHENPSVACSGCGAIVAVNEIGSDVYQDEDNEDIYVDQVCPICGHYDTFGEIEYESIQEALKH